MGVNLHPQDCFASIHLNSLSALEKSKVSIGKKLSKKRSKQNVTTTGNISLICFFFNLNFYM
jgi:hypothetical protein